MKNKTWYALVGGVVLAHSFGVAPKAEAKVLAEKMQEAVLVNVEETQPPPEVLAPYFEGSADLMAAAVTLHVAGKETVWLVPQKNIPVLFGKLRYLQSGAHAYDEIFKKIPENKAYTGVSISFIKKNGEPFPPLKFHDGGVYDGQNVFVHADPGRLMEYWVAGTAQSYAHQKDVLAALPVFDFEQCKSLGHVVVETQPRQCLMPNETVMLDMPANLKTYDLSVTNFAECLEKGTAIIQSFPRRCIGPTGLLFAEPPRRPDGSIILPESVQNQTAPQPRKTK